MSLWMKSYCVTIQMKPLQQYFHMVLFVLNVVLTLESVDEILLCDHSHETSSAVRSQGTTCFTTFSKMEFRTVVQIFSSERVKVLSVAHLLLAHAYPKVGLVELIRNIPTQRTKIPPLLNERMEETQTEQQFLPNLQGTVASLATATTPGRETQQNLL